MAPGAQRRNGARDRLPRLAVIRGGGGGRRRTTRLPRLVVIRGDGAPVIAIGVLSGGSLAG